MKRNEFIKTALISSAATTALLSSCASDSNESANVISNKKFRWRMVTTWPPNFPVLGEAANKFADLVKKLSAGRIEIKVYGGGELVPALEVFDAVSSGTADMGCGAAYYWTGKIPSSVFFTAIPFGLNAQGISSWILNGGGYQLWKEAYEKYDVIPFLGGNTGVQMGGWFNKEINTPNDIKGLKMRIPGMGGKVFEQAGGSAVLVSGGEVYTSLERGVIDACEWIGPYHDYKMGFHKIAKYYYSPGWHEPGALLEFTANKSIFNALPSDLQAIVEAASMQIHNWVLGEFDAKNGAYLSKILSESKVELKYFPEVVLKHLKTATDDTISDLIANDALAKKVYESYKSFSEKFNSWSKYTEQVYYNQIAKV